LSRRELKKNRRVPYPDVKTNGLLKQGARPKISIYWELRGRKTLFRKANCMVGKGTRRDKKKKKKKSIGQHQKRRCRGWMQDAGLAIIPEGEKMLQEGYKTKQNAKELRAGGPHRNMAPTK